MKKRNNSKLLLSLVFSICLWALGFFFRDSAVVYAFWLIPWVWVFFYGWQGIFYSVLAVEVQVVLEIIFDSQKIGNILSYESQVALTGVGIMAFVYSALAWMLLAFLRSVASDIRRHEDN